ncbi:MAG: hypothetical protein LBQ32_13605 [Burkholderiaceae bacterium]|nr:hypothetical protein [Burkholderiaceae bacterium]
MLSDQPWPPLAGQRDVAALPLALSTEFTGDRVAALPAPPNAIAAPSSASCRDW